MGVFYFESLVGGFFCGWVLFKGFSRWINTQGCFRTVFIALVLRGPKQTPGSSFTPSLSVPHYDT